MFEKKELSMAAHICLGLSVLLLLIEIIRGVSIYSFYNGSPVFSDHLVRIIFNVALIICAAFIFWKESKVALIVFALLSIVRIFSVVPADTNVSYGYFLGRNFVDFLKDFAPFYVAMFFPKNGVVSGWKTMFLNSQNYL